MPAPKPTLYVIAGPEGAGKSTFYETNLRHIDRSEFVNAEKIQRDVLKDHSPQGTARAENLAHERRQELIAQGKSFSTESTFDKQRDFEMVNAAQDKGYRVVLFHMQLRSPDLAVERVAARGREGGYMLPQAQVREGYANSSALVREAASKSDLAFVYDSSALNRAPQHLISLERGQLTKTHELQPLWSRELYAKELRQSTPEHINAAANSFRQAHAIGAKVAGPDARVNIAGHQPGQHQGPIVGVTTHHLVQKVGDKEFVAHFKERLAIQPVTMTDVKIVYGAGREHGSVEFTPPVRAESAPQQVAEQTRAYLNAPREQALKIHPELKPAYAAEDSLRKMIVQSRPGSEHVEKQVGDMVRQTIASRLQQGQTIEVSRPLADAVRYQVAHRSLDHAMADKLVHPEHPVRIDAAHRHILVTRAELVMRQSESKIQLPPAQDKAMNEAKDVAARLGIIDAGRSDNPFHSKALAETYKREAQRDNPSADRTLTRAVGKGLER